MRKRQLQTQWITVYENQVSLKPNAMEGIKNESKHLVACHFKNNFRHSS